MASPSTKDDDVISITGGESTASSPATPNVIFTRFERPDKFARIKIKGRSFLVHEEVLTKNSGYWKVKMDDSDDSVAPQRTLEYWDIEPDHFQAYVTIIYALFCRGSNEIKLSKEYLPLRRWIPDLVKLWNLASRFQHDGIRLLVEEEFEATLEFCESGTWWSGTPAQRNTRVCNYVEGYQVCPDDCPFPQRIVNSFCRGCPVELFAEKWDSLPREFLKAAALRYADLAKQSDDGRPRKRAKTEATRT